MRVALIFFIIFINFPSLAQDGRNQIKIPKNRNDKKCAKCIQVLSSKPDDILYGVHLDYDKLYFSVTDPEWLDLLLSKPTDGLAVDIVRKDQYSCSSRKIFKPTDYFRGVTLAPVFKKEIEKSKIYIPGGGVMFEIGQLPQTLLGEEIEFNLIIIQEKNYCFYHQFYDITDHKWELLETGLFADTLADLSSMDRAIILNKKFEFEIPFEKNKYEYKLEDVKPIYDSLTLYNYRIKSIEIEAYSSLEGDKENNKFLQQKRAESIIKALEVFQNSSIPKTIRTAENWVDFFTDIPKTKYANWTTLNKARIKEKLRDQKVLDDLEPILVQHRKAVLYLELENKFDVDVKDQKKLVALFNQAIEAKDIPKALDIQRSAYHYAKNESLPGSFLNQLEVPLSREYSLLYNNRIVFNYSLAPDYLYSALAEFRKLLEIVPDNPSVLYNIYALHLKAWSYSDPLIDRQELLDGIKQLKTTSLDPMLSDRLLINYNIILSEIYQYERKYKLKNEAVKNTYSIYRKMNLNSSDALSMAKYFIGYQKYSWAIALLKPYLNDIHTSEDLLFYYLNLTIIDPKMVGTASYRTLMLNAINKNQSRFCEQFNATFNGGVTFQLLDNLYLRKTYCENCK